MYFWSLIFFPDITFTKNSFWNIINNNNVVITYKFIKVQQ